MLACGKKEEKTHVVDTQSSQTKVETPVAKPTQPPGPSVKEDNFELTAKTADTYTAGKKANFEIELKPLGKFHVNKEYPIKVALTAPASVSFDKAVLQESDAKSFSEKEAKFEVPFTASDKGGHKVVAKVSFAVCTDENCMPDERTLAVTLAVQ